MPSPEIRKAGKLRSNFLVALIAFADFCDFYRHLDNNISTRNRCYAITQLILTIEDGSPAQDNPPTSTLKMRLYAPVIKGLFRRRGNVKSMPSFQYSWPCVAL